jgi:hypothetical protein
MYILSNIYNCSQQHNVVVIALAINLQKSWRFQRILPGSSSARAPYQEDPGPEVEPNPTILCPVLNRGRRLDEYINADILEQSWNEISNLLTLYPHP